MSSTMRSTTCLHNSRCALYRVFVAPTDRATLIPQWRLLSITRPRTPSPPQASIANQLRSFTRPGRRTRPPPVVKGDPFKVRDDDEEKEVLRLYTTKESLEASGRDRMPQDHEITDPMIKVLDAGVISGPLAPRHVLSKLRPEESLRMVKPYTPADRKEGTAAQFALCKVVDKASEYQRQREVRESKKAEPKLKVKVLELSWAIGPNDLATKMRWMGEFLEKGHKVELALGRKKGARKKIPEGDCERVLKSVRAEIERIGAREVKMADGALGGMMRLTVEKAGK